MTAVGQRQVGADLLGPVFARFLLRLHTAQLAYAPADTHVLFLARGGIRLRRFYQEFLAATRLPAPLVFDDFYVSRMSLIKAALHAHYEAVYEDLAREYPDHSVDRFVAEFFGAPLHARWHRVVSSALAEQRLTLATLEQAIWGDDSAADLLRRELVEQERCYRHYLHSIVRTRHTVLAVDTGWAGSILHYLQVLDPGRQYTALYFGRHNYGRPTPVWYPHVIGLAVEAERIGTDRPETALLAYRHLIEAVCEIRIPSVTGYSRSANGAAQPIGGPAAEDLVLPDDTEPIAQGILQYLRGLPPGLDIATVEAGSRRAVRQLWRRVTFPTARDVAALTVPARSADFGKELRVPVIVAAADQPDAKRMHIATSLWPAGQIAVEYPHTRLVRQYAALQLVGESRARRIARTARRRARSGRGKVSAAVGRARARIR